MANPRIEELSDDEPTNVKVEEQEDDSSDAESDIEVAAPSGSTTVIHSRNEKKARKLLEKQNLVRVEGITRVTLRRPKNVCLPDAKSAPQGFRRGPLTKRGS